MNLDAPSEPSRKMGRHSKWDVGTVQWNPHRSQAHIFAASVSSAVVRSGQVSILGSEPLFND